MGRRVCCFRGRFLDRERRATGAKQEATEDGGGYKRASGSKNKSWKQLKHAGRSKSAHLEGMLRCVGCSAGVGLTFDLQYVYPSKKRRESRKTLWYHSVCLLLLSRAGSAAKDGSN